MQLSDTWWTTDSHIDLIVTVLRVMGHENISIFKGVILAI